ncbi:MAG: MoaD/ThiS family protein [Chloroflexota bacterium]
MNINVRLNGALAQQIETTRLRVQLADSATVADLLDHLRHQYPNAASMINQTVPFVAGKHLSATTQLTPNQDIALLLPVAGG